METKLFIHPTYSLQYRGRKLALSNRQGLVMSRLMAAQGAKVLRSSIVSTVYQEEVRMTGASDFDSQQVNDVMKSLDALLEGWPVSIEREAGMFYRVVERKTKHRAG
jgi:hypothetical protein